MSEGNGVEVLGTFLHVASCIGEQRHVEYPQLGLLMPLRRQGLQDMRNI